MSMLRALYEIPLPVDAMMELRRPVIPSFITVSAGKYTMPWIIDRAISALLLTNLKAPQKGHVMLKNIFANMLILCVLFRDPLLLLLRAPPALL